MSVESILKHQLDKIVELKSVYGAPGDYGYDTPAGDALYRLYVIGAALSAWLPEIVADARDAARYRWLRSRDAGAVHNGGVFIGVTPANLVITGEDADRHVDAGRALDGIVADLVKG